MVSAGADGRCFVWDALLGLVRVVIPVDALDLTAVTACALLPGVVLCGSASGVVSAWRYFAPTRKGAELVAVPGTVAPAGSAAADGGSGGGGDGVVGAVAAQPRGIVPYEPLWRHVVHAGRRVNGISVSDDGRFLFSGGDDGVVVRVDAATGTEAIALRGHDGPVTSVAATFDGTRAVSSSHDGTLRTWAFT